MDNIIEGAINIFTDGSSYSGPRRGGMGVRFVVIDEQGHEQATDHELLGHAGANNQQMELQACVEAFDYLLGKYSAIALGDFRKVVVYTDSMYVYENYNKAKYEWPKSRWTTRSGSPVANAEIWKNLVKKSQKLGMPVEFHWVKGHKSSEGNKAADKLAKQSAKGTLRAPLAVVSVRRKNSSKSVAKGGVILSGQRLTIRIIVTEWLNIQKLWKYKYEVVCKGNPFYGSVDVAYSHVSLRDGHTYFVLMNNDEGNPRILKTFREI